MSNHLIKKTCNVCGTLTSKKCSKCNVIFYCNRSCQVTDWAVHKFFCASLPFPICSKCDGQINGILLKENSTVPELVKIPLNRKFEEDYVVTMLPNTDMYFDDITSYFYMQRNLFTQTNLKDTLCIEYKDNFLNDGSLPNKCIQKLINTEYDCSWRGPILIIKMKGLRISEDIYDDMNEKDFKDVVDFFYSYHRSRLSI